MIDTIRLGSRESEGLSVVVLVLINVRVILEILKIGLEVIGYRVYYDVRSQGLREVIARVFLLLRIRWPQDISRQPATARWRNDVGDDRTAVHRLSFPIRLFPIEDLVMRN